MTVKERKQQRFARQQKRANTRDRKCELDPENNPRDQRVLDHRLAAANRCSAQARMIIVDFEADSLDMDKRPTTAERLLTSNIVVSTAFYTGPRFTQRLQCVHDESFTASDPVVFADEPEEREYYNFSGHTDKGVRWDELVTV